MAKNTIVVRPSENQTKKDQYDDIVKNKVARGFAASYENVQKMNYIIITDGKGSAHLAEINKVTHYEIDKDDKKKRVKITFKNVREPENLFKKIHRGENNPNGIKWSSNNVRYIELPPLG